MELTKMRLLEFLKYKKLSQQRFEISIGMSNGWVDKVGNSIRKGTLAKISEAYPELDTNWLLCGVGSMLKSDTTEEERCEFTPGDKTGQVAAKLVYLLPISAQGGSLNDFVVSIKGSDCEKIVSPIRGADFAISVSGDSMAPEYPNGSQIFIKKINERAFIDWGRAYVLDTCNGTVIKILVPSEKDGYIRCESINKDPKYAPFEVNMEDVYGIYRVLLCMSIK